MKSQKIGFVAAIIAAILMGGFGVLVRNVSMDGHIVAFSRLVLGFLFLTVYLLIRRNWQVFKIKFSAALFFSGIFLALGVVFYIASVKATTLANAVFLLYLAPLIVSILGHFYLKEKISALNIALILLAFIGFLCLLEFNFSLAETAMRGQLFGLAAAFSYAFFILANRKIDPVMSGYSRAFYQLLCSSLVLLPFVGKIDLSALYQDAVWLLAIGFFQGFLAISLMTLALRHLQSYEYATVSYLDTIVATIAGYFIYQESLSWLQITGCVLIFAAGIMQIWVSMKNFEKQV
ncbi:hypothetical protein DOJK_00996 [Patescibacteria group bacterium]|nr:hypothetical protein DOJK_00996 [Patescibacteria group bacterium]